MSQNTTFTRLNLHRPMLLHRCLFLCSSHDDKEQSKKIINNRAFIDAFYQQDEWKKTKIMIYEFFVDADQYVNDPSLLYTLLHSVNTVHFERHTSELMSSTHCTNILKPSAFNDVLDGKFPRTALLSPRWKIIRLKPIVHRLRYIF